MQWLRLMARAEKPAQRRLLRARTKLIQPLCLLVLWAVAGALAASEQPQSLQRVKQAAEGGHVPSQYQWALALENSQQDKQAERWFRLAAESGHALAQWRLGVLYQEGRGGLARDNSQALLWIKKAADQADAVEAQYHLAVAYQNGDLGLQPDPVAHTFWLVVAAERNHPPAQYDLAQLLLSGTGAVTADAAEALAWLKKSAEAGFAPAQYAWAESYRTGQYGQQLDDAEAERWHQKALSNQHDPSLLMLVNLWLEGRLSAEPKGLLPKLQQAAGRGVVRAQWLLGRMFDAGVGVKANAGDAISWYRSAAEGGDAEAQTALALMYAQGRVVAANDAEAVLWFRRAAASGYGPALFYLARMNQGARGGLSGEAQLGVQLLAQAATWGYPPAQFELAQHYHRGQHLATNLTEALRWYEKAAVAGHANAQLNLAQMYLNQLEPALKDPLQGLYWLWVLSFSKLPEAELAEQVREQLQLAVAAHPRLSPVARQAASRYLSHADQRISQRRQQWLQDYRSQWQAASSYEDFLMFYLSYQHDDPDQRVPEAIQKGAALGS